MDGNNMKDKMKLTQRTCAGCAHFNRAPEGDEPTCWNRTTITANYGTPQAVSREPGPGDWCSNHQTVAEYAAETDEIDVAQHREFTIAIGLGAAIRGTAGAVAVLFAVLLVVPGLVMLLPHPWDDNVTKYLPGAAGEAMAAVTKFPNLLGPLAGLVVMCLYTAGTLLLGGLALSRRDA